MVYLSDVESPIFFISFLVLQKWPKIINKASNLSQFTKTCVPWRYVWTLQLELFSSTLWWAFIRRTWVVMWKLKKWFRFNISLWWLDSFSERDHILNIWYRRHELVAESKEQDADQRYKCQPKYGVQEPRQPSQTGYPTASTLKVEIGKKNRDNF